MKQRDAKLMNKADTERKAQLLEFASAVTLALNPQDIAAGIKELMGAKCVVKAKRSDEDKVDRGGRKNGAMGDWEILDEQPDLTARNNGLKLALAWFEITAAYEVGKPVERQEIVTHTVESPEQRAARLFASPSGLAALVALGVKKLDESEEGKRELEQAMGGE